MKKLKLVADLHTHTLASDGCHTILEVAQIARKKGLAMVGISDHVNFEKKGSNYFWVFARRTPSKFEGIKIIKSIETSILNDGSYDWPKDWAGYLDLILAGFHKEEDNINLGENRYTQMVLDCFAKNRVDVLVHPCTKTFPLDLEKVVRVAAEKGIAVEINNTNLRMAKTDLNKLKQLLDLVKKYHCRIVANSDGHNWGEIGCFEEIEKFINNNNFDPKLFLNSDKRKLLDFIKERKELKYNR